MANGLTPYLGATQLRPGFLRFQVQYWSAAGRKHKERPGKSSVDEDGFAPSPPVWSAHTPNRKDGDSQYAFSGTAYDLSQNLFLR